MNLLFRLSVWRSLDLLLVCPKKMALARFSLSLTAMLILRKLLLPCQVVNLPTVSWSHLSTTLSSIIIVCLNNLEKSYSLVTKMRFLSHSEKKKLFLNQNSFYITPLATATFFASIVKPNYISGLGISECILYIGIVKVFNAYSIATF